MDFLVIDGGEEVMRSWVRMWSARSRAFTRTMFDWHRVPMAQVKDLPKAMQCQVVGVPRAWVRLFRQLTRAVVLYHDQNPLLLRLRYLTVFIFVWPCIMFWWLRRPNFVLWHLCSMTSHFGCFNEKPLWWSILFIYMCVKMYVCDVLMVYETNFNLTYS